MRVFISYANAASEEIIVDWLAALLAASGIEVWIDTRHLKSEPGLRLNRDVALAIRDGCDAFVYLASALSIASDYCRSEVAYALQCSKPFLTLLLEQCQLPGELLPIRGPSRPFVELHRFPRREWVTTLQEPFAAVGIALRLGPEAPADAPTSRVIRPNFSELKTMSQGEISARAARLREAKGLNPTNGYIDLNIAYLLLFAGNAPGAAAAARSAAELLPFEPAAYVADALALCANHPVSGQQPKTAQVVLGRLTYAMSLPGANSQAFLMAAVFVCNFHRRKFFKLPLSITETLSEGRASHRRNIDENRRTYALQPLIDRRHEAELGEIVRAYLGYASCS